MKKYIILLSFLTLSSLAFADQSYKVKSVVDGDTLAISNSERVTLAGIDTPEVYHNRKLYYDAKKNGLDLYEMMGLGKEARLFVRQMVQGRKIRVEADVEEKNGRGDLLGYVFLKVCDAACKYEPVPGHEYVTLDDGVYDFINATLVKSGFAEASPALGGLKYRDLFETLQKEAQNQQSGFWTNSHQTSHRV